MNYKVLYNPLAGKTDDVSFREQLAAIYKDQKLEFYDITKVNYPDFFAATGAETGVIVAGGDGTLNRFVNDTDGIEIASPLFYYAAGTGNDFWSDLGKKAGDPPVALENLIKNLPVCTVNGKKYKFVNNAAGGIDSYCCVEGERQKAKGKKVNYTSIAIKGLLLKYKSFKAEITVDGVAHSYKNVWIAPAMFGRYYGGGMIPTPAQNRNAAEKTLSCCVFHGRSRLGTLIVFPKIFKGEHIKSKKRVEILSGKQMTVKFSRPLDVQLDGEIINNVSEYSVYFE